ncbi:MOSC domain-containing protein [Cytobacillus sp. FJAT-54145]|uniref:MOSC domain-containing protein n=1 Tax=Cytobacillus spartinae TaxID=3299023 RepID=A0ABW6KEX3_9BACI
MQKIVTLSVGRPKEYEWKGKQEKSGIGKSIVNEVRLTKDGFIGDEVAAPEFHGGPDRAVCLYPFEHYAMWEKEFGQILQPPAFGENICVTNMLEKDTYIGDTYLLGETVIQVTQGRVPCSKISKFNGIDKLLGRIVETGFTGYFFRVLQEGTVKSDAELKLIDRTQEKITILRANEVMLHDKKNIVAIEEILQVNELADEWRNSLTKTLKKLTEKSL